MRLRRPQDSSRELLWCILLWCLLLLLLAGPTARAQSESPPEPLSSNASYSEVEQNLALLVERLAERKLQMQSLQASLEQADARLNDYAASLATLEGQLEQARLALQTSQADLTETSNWLAALSKRYDDLEKFWQNYRDEMLSQVTQLRRARDGWKWTAIGSGGVALVSLALLLIQALK